jgi:hypothetical protein
MHEKSCNQDEIIIESMCRAATYLVLPCIIGDAMPPKIRVPHIRVEAPSDILPGQQKQQQEVAFLRPLERSDQNESDPSSSSSSFRQGTRSSKRTTLTPPNDFHESNQIRDFKGEYRTVRIQSKAKSSIDIAQV